MDMTSHRVRKPIDPTHGAEDETGITFTSWVTQTEAGLNRSTEGSVIKSKSVTPLWHIVEEDLGLESFIQADDIQLKNGY